MAIHGKHCCEHLFNRKRSGPSRPDSFSIVASGRLLRSKFPISSRSSMTFLEQIATRSTVRNCCNNGTTACRVKIMNDQNRLAKLGMRFFLSGTKAHVRSQESDCYYYETFAGSHTVAIQAGDCLFWLSDDRKSAHLSRGPSTILTPHFATMIRGFAPESKSSTITGGTVLPYINGCSTKQIFAPDRPGDPTLQVLHMPPGTSEQHHHIHPTARCVYILSGRGKCIVGMGDPETVTLETGSVCVFDPMSPHHFETESEALTVLPVHVWSSSGSEHDHPMFNGTFRT